MAMYYKHALAFQQMTVLLRAETQAVICQFFDCHFVSRVATRTGRLADYINES